jgi:hypothetical protein
MNILNNIKAIEAPDWFVKNMKEVKDMQYQISIMFGINPQELEDEKVKALDEKIDNIGNKNLSDLSHKFVDDMFKKYSGNIPELSEEDKEKRNLLMEVSNYLQKYSWLKFQLDNYNNNFGKSRLYYDEKNKFIKIV